MYRVAVRSGFRASHALLLPDGQREEVHHHDWKVEASFAGPTLDPTGMLVDFDRVAAALNKMVGRLNGCDLHDQPEFVGVNPSAEHVARVVFEALTGVVDRGELLESVCVEEAPGCTATYSRTNAAVGPAAVDAVRTDL
ncbi:MAG: 6-carboxytetrahydropterin synthase [bacterium]|nr:6-carboxytetrahydropterin synthase [bacterium]